MTTVENMNKQSNRSGIAPGSSKHPESAKRGMEQLTILGLPNSRFNIVQRNILDGVAKIIKIHYGQKRCALRGVYVCVNSEKEFAVESWLREKKKT